MEAALLPRLDTHQNANPFIILAGAVAAAYAAPPFRFTAASKPSFPHEAARHYYASQVNLPSVRQAKALDEESLLVTHLAGISRRTMMMMAHYANSSFPRYSSLYRII